MMKITVHFKESEKFIYDKIMEHSSKSGWIKDVLKDHIKNPPQPEPRRVYKDGN